MRLLPERLVKSPIFIKWYVVAEGALYVGLQERGAQQKTFLYFSESEK